MATCRKGVRPEGVVVRAAGPRWEWDRHILARGRGVGRGAVWLELSVPGESKEGRSERAQATVFWFLLGRGGTGRF